MTSNSFIINNWAIYINIYHIAAQLTKTKHICIIKQVQVIWNTTNSKTYKFATLKCYFNLTFKINRYIILHFSKIRNNKVKSNSIIFFAMNMICKRWDKSKYLIVSHYCVIFAEILSISKSSSSTRGTDATLEWGIPIRSKNGLRTSFVLSLSHCPSCVPRRTLSINEI